jgi:hypothetical protein
VTQQDFWSGNPVTYTNAESGASEWAIVRSNPAGAPADGTVSVNTITIAPAGTFISLDRIVIMRVGVNGGTFKHHWRIVLLDGDGVDRETFGHFRIGGGEGTAGVTGFAYDTPEGALIEIGRQGTNGLQLILTGYADGGHVTAMVMFRKARQFTALGASYGKTAT